MVRGLGNPFGADVLPIAQQRTHTAVNKSDRGEAVFEKPLPMIAE